MLEAVLIVRSLCLMEVVHVKLPDKRREVVVLEEARQDTL